MVVEISASDSCILQVNGVDGDEHGGEMVLTSQK